MAKRGGYEAKRSGSYRSVLCGYPADGGAEKKSVFV